MRGEVPAADGSGRTDSLNTWTPCPVFLLDSGTLNLAFRGQAQVSARILRTPYEDIHLSAISAEEML